MGNGLASDPYSHSLKQDEQQQQESQEQRRFYIVTDGLRSKQTALVYKSAFNGFIRYLQGVDLKILLDYRMDAIESKFISYLEYLRDVRKLSYSTILTHYSAIFHFFDMNSIGLNWRKIKKFLPSEDSENYRGDRPYSIEEVRRILDRCDIRERVIVLLMASTGMRVGAIPGLRISDIRKIEEFNLYLVNVYANSRKGRYYVFTTPECAGAIDDYLAYRKRLGEEIKDSSPLIRNHISVDNPFTAKTPRSIGIRAIQLIIEDLKKEAGVALQRGQVMRTHGFRKFAITMMKKARVDFSDREYLVGHKHSRGLDVNYDRTSEDDRLVEWSKAINNLTIDPAFHMKKKLELIEGETNQRIAEQEQEIARLKAKEHEDSKALGELSKEFNEMKQLLVHLSKDSQKQLLDEFKEKVEDKADIEWSCD